MRPTSLLLAGALLVGTAATTAAWTMAPAEAPAPIAMRVVKSPTCGCCQKWIDYMKAQGFAVTVENREEFTDLKRQHGVTQELQSCHTAFVGGYVVEGHVPADLVKKMLAEKPAGVKGLSAPGMPMGSPGMEGPVKERYTVYSFDAKGTKSAYSVR